MKRVLTTRCQIWDTIELHCASENLTHKRRPKKFEVLFIGLYRHSFQNMFDVL